MSHKKRKPAEQSALQKDQQSLFNLMVWYCVGVIAWRIFAANVGYIAFTDPMAPILAWLPPVIGLVWLLISDFSDSGLAFVNGISFIAIFNHFLCTLSYIVVPLFGYSGQSDSIKIPFSIICSLIFAGFAVAIFNLCRKMHKEQKAKRIPTVDRYQEVKADNVGESTNQTKHSLKEMPKKRAPDRTKTLIISFIVLLFISPFIPFDKMQESIYRMFNPLEKVTPFKVDSNIEQMAGSPDGKLLALGARKALYVWDVETEQCVWSDDTIGVQKVKFSEDGKYLAAAGRGIPEGSSDIVVYEVDGFRRLAGFDWPEKDLRMEKVFHDIAFRPGDTSMLFAWHRDWDWTQMTKEEEGRIYRKEIAEHREEWLQTNPVLADDFWRVRELICTEFDMKTGEEQDAEAVAPLVTHIDLLQDGAVYFLHGGRYLFYPECRRVDGYLAIDRVWLADTQDWSKREEIFLPSEYDMSVRAVDGLYEWKFDRSGRYGYFLAETRGNAPRHYGDKYLGGKAFVIMRLDLEAKKFDEVFRLNVPREHDKSAWLRMAFSPNEERVALLGFGEAFYDYGGLKEGAIALRFVNLKSGVSELRAMKQLGSKSIGWNIYWLIEGKLAVSLNTDWKKHKLGEFFFVNVDKEGE